MCMNEKQTIDFLNKKIKGQNEDHGIKVKCGKYDVENVTGCVNINGTKKADFALENSEGEKVLYISHKKSNWGYNGYGSVGKKAYKEGNRSPTKHPLIFKIMKWAREECIKHNPGQNNLNGIVEWTGEDGTRGRIMTPPKELQKYLIYGVDFTNDKKKYGENNCHIIGVGDPCLIKAEDDTFELSFTNETLSNDTLPSGDAELVLVIGGPVGDSQKAGGKQEKIIKTESEESNKGLRGWVGIFPIQGLKRKIDPITPDNLRNSKLKNLKWVD